MNDESKKPTNKVWENEEGDLEVSFGEEASVLDAVCENFTGYLAEDTEDGPNRERLQKAFTALVAAKKLVMECLSGAPVVK